MSSDWLPSDAGETGAGWVLGGRYQLISQVGVGVGGMAVVWQAYDTVLARTVAVKVLAAHTADDPQSRQRIRREAQAAAAHSHPNIAQVYDYGESEVNGEITPNVVMELIRGDSLQQRMIDGPVPARYAMRVCAEIAAALSAAHTEGLVHRDIKPAKSCWRRPAPRWSTSASPRRSSRRAPATTTSRSSVRRPSGARAPAARRGAPQR